MQHPHGYSAARAVYDALELRFAVYDLIDRTTLVTCMRLHKGGMLAVAKCLYGEVHITRMQGMNRKSVSLPRFDGGLNLMNGREGGLRLSEPSGIIADLVALSSDLSGLGAHS